MEKSKKVKIALSTSLALVAIGCLGAYVFYKYNNEEWDI